MKEGFRSKIQGKKIALVLSGGVVRAAAWHLGVALALEELGFSLKGLESSSTGETPLDISTYVGSSAGAMISTYFANGYGPHDIINATIGEKSPLKPIRYQDILYLWRPKVKTKRPNYFDPLKSFPLFIRNIAKPFYSTSGFFSTEGLRQYLKKHVLKSENFEDYSADLFIIATQLDHSRKVIFSKYNYPNPRHDSTSHYYTNTNISDANAASMSVPPFYTPFPIENSITGAIDYYIDGEIRDTLSTHVAIDNNCEIIISSWTHTPYHFHDEIGSLAHYGISSIATQAIYLMIQKKIVSSRASVSTAKDLLDTVHSFMKKENFNQRQINEIMKIIETKLNYKHNVRFIDIYPDHDDYQTFFANPFTLEREVMSRVMKQGYRKTLKVFGDLSEEF
ncbi:MAG: patatin-like phospholipase family protein [Halobacteriovoraceae bacterium]|nr:patatin-like phospholipase family protein [Halobacteriovoraceae bacterium]